MTRKRKMGERKCGPSLYTAEGLAFLDVSSDPDMGWDYERAIDSVSS